MKSSFAKNILSLSDIRFAKLKNDLIDSWAHNTSSSALVAWVSSMIDLRKNPDGLTAEQILEEIVSVR